MSSILVTLFLGDESGKVCQKTFVSLSKNSGRKEKDRKAAAKLLAIQANKYTDSSKLAFDKLRYAEKLKRVWIKDPVLLII